MKSTKSSKPLKVLFIGNSFTARNNLPGLIAQLAAARGKAVEHRLVNMGGASLRMHWNKGEAQREIETGKYDYVVLQEQSTLPVKNAKRMRENVLLFDPMIRAASARATLYQTWARKHTPQSQQAITDAYNNIGREIGALVVPVGEAWQKFLAEHDQPVLHDKDGSHPSLAGSYLAACVFLARMLDVSPIGIDTQVAGIGSEDAKLLHRAAAQA
jgi:hypothetical protein